SPAPWRSAPPGVRPPCHGDPTPVPHITPPWRRAPNPSPHIAAPLPASAAPERRRSEAIYTPVPHLLTFPAARRRAGPVAPCRPRPRPRRGRRRGPARQRGPRRSGGGDLPSVRPQPRTMEPGEHGMDLGGKVSIIVGRDTDPAALSDLEALLERPGGPVDVVLAADESTTVNGPRTHLATTEDNPTVARVLSGLGVEGPAALAPDGYVLATGRDRGPVAVLA